MIEYSKIIELLSNAVLRQISAETLGLCKKELDFNAEASIHCDSKKGDIK